MTRLSTALALLTIAPAGDKPGQEIEDSMAVLILGGLPISTVLNLAVMPAAGCLFAQWQRGGPPSNQ